MDNFSRKAVENTYKRYASYMTEDQFNYYIERYERYWNTVKLSNGPWFVRLYCFDALEPKLYVEKEITDIKVKLKLKEFCLKYADIGVSPRTSLNGLRYTTNHIMDRLGLYDISDDDACSKMLEEFAEIIELKSMCDHPSKWVVSIG